MYLTILCVQEMARLIRETDLLITAVTERVGWCYHKSLLPDATLHVIAGGAHDLARTHADEIAPLITAHLTRQRRSGWRSSARR